MIIVPLEQDTMLWAITVKFVTQGFKQQLFNLLRTSVICQKLLFLDESVRKVQPTVIFV